MPNQTTDPTPYLFLAAMIVIGGMVAWVADGLGRKIGKKRLSFLGLRPRYTATLITVGAGVLIPILTIGAIYALSGDVREWIQKGKGAIDDAREKTEQVKLLDEKARGLEKQQKKLQGQISGLEGKTGKLTSQLSHRQADLAKATKMLQSAQKNVQQLSSSVKSKESQLRVTNARVKTNNQKILSLREREQQLQGKIGSLTGNFKTVDSQRKEAYTELLRVNNEIARVEGESRKLEAQKQTLAAQIEESKKEIATYQGTIREQQAQIGSNNEQLEDLKSKLTEAGKLFGANFEATRLRPLIFEASQELARVQLPPSLSPVAARNAFFDLLQRARTVALTKKALNSPMKASAGLTDRQINGRYVSEREQEEALIRAITSQRTELVLIARSFFNSFEGEYVLLEFVAYRNKLVYSEGKLVLERRLDGRRSEAEILDQIKDFIETNVRAQALKDGMIPPSGRSGELTSIEMPELLRLMYDIKSYNQPVRLQALAKSDINAGDKLELNFRVRP